MSSASISFVIQVEPPPAGTAAGAATPIQGRIENLDSGEWRHFRSSRELLSFLRSALEPREPAA